MDCLHSNVVRRCIAVCGLSTFKFCYTLHSCVWAVYAEMLLYMLHSCVGYLHSNVVRRCIVVCGLSILNCCYTLSSWGGGGVYLY